MEDFFYSILSYDRDKKKEREYRVQDGEPAVALQMVMLCKAAAFLTPEWETHLSLIK
ncbi:hypothetical protein [Bacillus haynesii]|uniref:hypothetical protein n=1 Tax=Bacillus haynesii TaxID=1925021 RepID=UPI003D07119B